MESIGARNNFITFEGGEGSGKTTVIDLVAEELIDKGYKVMRTREPGGVCIAEQIRNVILNKSNTEMDYMTELLLYAAARREHLVHKVLPALNEGYIVLCDRFVDSTYVYQGYARGLGIEKVRQVNELVVGDLMPSKTFYIDVSPEVGLGRIGNNDSREKNRLDLEKFSFHEKVREGYLYIEGEFGDRIELVDGERTVEEVVGDVLGRLLK